MKQAKKNYSVGIQTGVEHGKYYTIFYVIYSAKPTKVHSLLYGVVTGAVEILSAGKKIQPKILVDGGENTNPFFHNTLHYTYMHITQY